MKAVSLVLVCFVLQSTKSDGSDNPIVGTKSGPVAGEVLLSRGGQRYHAFLGIPYAEPPERFKVAKPVKPWTEVRDATSPGQICPQIMKALDMFIGDENCLYLNVYSPDIERCGRAELLPVLFYIHGGSFTSGSGSFSDPKFFMDDCIVFVSINYRLGALSIRHCFLTTEDEEMPGNLGLKDALLALRWVRVNIEYFRGDKNAITLQGVSSGAAMVSHFIASPAAKGLFHRGIAQSGSSLNPFALVSGARSHSFHLGSLVNCSSNTSHALLQCLKYTDAEAIIVHQSKLKAIEFAQVPLGPVIEPADALDPFLTEHPYLLLQKGAGSHVPLMNGMTEQESFAFLATPLEDPDVVKGFSNQWETVAPFIYDYNFLNISRELKAEIGDRIRKFYMASNNKDIPWEPLRLMDSVSDRYFHMGILEEAEFHSRYAPVYNYVLTFKGNFSFSAIQDSSTHGDELQYLFSWPAVIPEPKEGTIDYEFSLRLVRLWTSFVKTGRPTAIWPDASNWSKFHPKMRATLRLDIPMGIVLNHLEDKLKFWTSLKLREMELRFHNNLSMR